MDQIKIGKFIQERRKKVGITQSELAEKLYVTDRAVSKWENGVCIPDASNVIQLCKLLDITINDLYSGEKVDMKDNEKLLEKNLLEMAKKEELQNKKMMFYEMVIGYMSCVTFLILLFTSSFAVENMVARIILFILAFLVLIIGVSFALKIETETGYYECLKCHHQYVPKYSKVYFAMHIGTTRYMKCPKCNKRSWQKKIISKN